MLAKISASLPITEIILSAAALRSHLPDLSRLIATITNIPVYTLETEVEDHLLSGAFQHIRMELAKVGNFNLVDGIVPSSAIVLVSEPDSIFSKYYSGIMTEYERIQNLLEKGLI